MPVPAIYLLEMAFFGTFTLGTVRVGRVVAALQTQPPAPEREWPLVRPLIVATRRFGAAVSKLAWVGLGVILGVCADEAGQAALQAVAQVVAVTAMALLTMHLAAGGARFGMQCSRTVRAHPDLGITTQPVWLATFSGALTAVTGSLAVITALASA